jgi:hypothetical protein
MDFYSKNKYNIVLITQFGYSNFFQMKAQSNAVVKMIRL